MPTLPPTDGPTSSPSPSPSLSLSESESYSVSPSESDDVSGTQSLSVSPEAPGHSYGEYVIRSSISDRLQSIEYELKELKLMMREFVDAVSFAYNLPQEKVNRRLDI